MPRNIRQLLHESRPRYLQRQGNKRRQGDPAELVAISTLAQDMIGWQCEYSDIKTILQSMWEVYSKH